MPLKPVPTRPAGQRGRATTLATLAPVAALVVVVLVAWAGAVAEALAPSPAERSTASLAAERDGEARAEPPVLPGMDLSIAPRVAFGLAVADVHQTLERRHAGEIRRGLVAVAGYLTVDPRDRDCADRRDEAAMDAFCERSAILSATADPVLTVNWNENGGTARRLGMPRSHLHPQVLPGTAIPPGLVTRPDPRIREITPVAVVVIGRFDDPRARKCHPGLRHCGDEFVLERVAWANGQWIDRPVVRDPTIPAAQTGKSSAITRLLTSRESDRGEIILSEALLTVDLLGDVDPAAATALGGGAGGPVWYVRSVGRAAVDADERREWPVAWAVVDHESGLVLATGDTG
jgi:hypothetical protein